MGDTEPTPTYRGSTPRPSRQARRIRFLNPIVSGDFRLTGGSSPPGSETARGSSLTRMYPDSGGAFGWCQHWVGRHTNFATTPPHGLSLGTALGSRFQPKNVRLAIARCGG